MKIVNRIRDSNDFAITIKNGHAKSNSCFTLHYIKTNSGYTRVGISVSTKLGCAVVRNRVKRQLRSMCDNLLNYNEDSYDLVIVARKPFLENTFDQNKSLLADLLKIR